MRPVDIGVAEQADAVVAQLAEVERFPDAGPQGDHQRTDLVTRQHAIQAGLFDVQHLPEHREHRLEAPIATLFGRTPS